MEYYLIGLGNPVREYEGTRHNVGERVVSYLHTLFGCGGWQAAGRAAEQSACVISKRQERRAIHLMRPRCYMNESEKIARALPKGALPENIIVVHDDLDIPLGAFKCSRAKGAGGHKGVQSFINALGMKDFFRVRVGIAPVGFFTGAPKKVPHAQVPRFVLGRMSKREEKKIQTLLPRIEETIRDIVF